MKTMQDKIASCEKQTMKRMVQFHGLFFMMNYNDVFCCKYIFGEMPQIFLNVLLK